MNFDNNKVFERIVDYTINVRFLSTTANCMKITDRIEEDFIHEADTIDLANVLNNCLCVDFIKSYHIHRSQTFEQVFNKIKTGKIR